MKNILEFNLDGKPVFIEIEETASQRVSRSTGSILKAENLFLETISSIKPAIKGLFNTFFDINTPDEIGLDFGIKLNAKAGAVFASAGTDATFKVSLKWKNKME